MIFSGAVRRVIEVAPNALLDGQASDREVPLPYGPEAARLRFDSEPRAQSSGGTKSRGWGPSSAVTKWI
jgi:hypothetical protein